MKNLALMAGFNATLYYVIYCACYISYTAFTDSVNYNGYEGCWMLNQQRHSFVPSSPLESTTVILFLPVLWRLSQTKLQCVYSMLPRASPATWANWRSCSMRSSTGLTFVWRSSWWSWSIDARTAGHFTISPFTAAHCLASQRHLWSTERNLLHVWRRRLYTYGRRGFVIAGSSAWNIFRTLSTIRTPPKLL